MATAKPATVTLNAAHAFAEHLLLMVPFTEGTGQPGIVRGADGVSAGAPTSTTWNGVAGTWSTNSGGACIHGISGTTGQLRLGTDGNWLPTGDCTICIVRGHANSGFAVDYFAISSGGTSVLGIYLPFNDTKVYWDYGGTGSPNRISVSSLTFTLNPPDTWVFTSGAAGSAIYQNGVKVASQSTAITRVANAARLDLMFAGDTADFNFFQISGMQWNDARAIAWAADPYAHLVAASNSGIATSVAVQPTNTVSPSGSIGLIPRHWK